MSALNGWHRGERIVREKLGFDEIPSTAHLWSSISGEMPEQHSTFYTTRLPFVPVCILDDEGRPWGSILAGKDGKPGFIHHPKYNTLSIEAKLWTGDPFLKVVKNFDRENGSTVIAGIGVEVSTRRRNKFAGNVTKMAVTEGSLSIELTVNEALGNCPKYIALRELTPSVHASSVVIEDKPHLEVGERLSDGAVAFILESDTVFFGTTYAASREDSPLYPSHLGMNHRGGRPGFIRVKPSDGRTVVLPDFSGNRFMTSLGNVEATPFASLTFISFTRGDVLYLTGNARNVYGLEARAVMPLHDTLTEIFVTGYTYVQNALPARQGLHDETQASPYSPPIKLLAEEVTQAKIFSLEQQPTALLTRITVHSPTIATFEWESSIPIRVEPGQAIIMDFSTLLGSRQYQHMSPRKPSMVNDDFIRTWTISSASAPHSDSRRFSLTVREKPGGVVTGAMFGLVRKLVELKPEALEDARNLSLSVGIVGVTGDFVLPRVVQPKKTDLAVKTNVRRLLWIAGGIGVTPFLSMLSSMSLSTASPLPYDITFLISTREPDITVSLITSALGESKSRPYLSIHIFTNIPQALSGESEVGFTQYDGRIQASFFDDKKYLFEDQDTEMYLCGPEPFERFILDSLAKFGVDPGKVHMEAFAY